MELYNCKRFMFFTFVFILFIHCCYGLHFGRSSYSKFPKWNACVNASISFEFKTTTSDCLLMYTDDNGKFDYVEIVLKAGRVRLRMNIVDGRDGEEEIDIGSNLHDNKWHKVELKRNRMESTLYVDGQHKSQVAFGSDFNFGEISRNNYVYFGGLPRSYYTVDENKLSKLSLSSAFFEPRFQGEMRNILYGNCSCTPVRGDMIEGESVSREPREACELGNNCGDCLCISKDDGAGCQCIGIGCDADTTTYYQLPMDEVLDDKLINPSGLDATVTGSPQTVSGVVGHALKIDEKFQKIKVTGPGHRNECFGDLDLCPEGYTLGMWLRFDEPGPGNGIYISNGGQRDDGHGIAMLYKIGHLEWIFKSKLREWRVTANNILPRHWYHVGVTWHKARGLALYINGNKMAHSGSSSRSTPFTSTVYNDFIIGQSNDGTGSGDLGTMTIDEFQFWATHMEDTVLREKGPIYKHWLSMDQLVNGQLIVKRLETKVTGIVRQVPGKIGNAVELTGNGEFIDLGSFHKSCFGKTSLCLYGITVSLWVKFNEMKDNTYYIDSGLEGFTIFSMGKLIYVTVQEGDRKWMTSVSGLQTGTWYFLELTWSRTTGLRVYINRNLKSIQLTSIHEPIKSSFVNHFYVGRANTAMYRELFANATFDDIEVFNAERKRLLDIDFIQRGRPDKTYIGFDRMVDNKVDHPNLVIETTGLPALVPGKVFQALHLNGLAQSAQFIHGDGCLGNMDYCLHGVLLALWIRPEEFEEGMYYLSSGINGISVSRVDQKIRVMLATTTLKWQVLTADMTPMEWYYMEISWDPELGLELYLNNKMVAADMYGADNPETDVSTQLSYDKFILGKNNGYKIGSLYGTATYDELEFWSASRDYLIAFQYIQRGQPTHYKMNMDIILDHGRRLAHPVLPIKLHGNVSLVSGVRHHGNALQLNAAAQIAQYIDLGSQTDKCLGNLKECKFGITVSFWMKIETYYNNMFIFSTGVDGIRIYYQTGDIYFRLDRGTETWRVTIPKVSEKVWHLMEISWHPDFRMNIYVDKRLRTSVEARSKRAVYIIGTRDFLIGAPNSADSIGQEFSYANMAVDDFEVWYARREYLLAFGYILRGHVEYESFSMETATGDVIFHPRYRVTLEQGASLVPGKIGNAVSLQGNGQYVNLGDHMDECMANLDLCDLGITIALWIKPKGLKDKTYYLSGPMYDLYYDNGQLKSRFISRGKEWKTTSPIFADDAWNLVTLSWDREDGLKMFLDNRVVDTDVTPKDIMIGDQESTSGGLYVGRYSGPPSSGTTSMQADEVQYWYANIERLASQGMYGFPVHEVIPISRLGQLGVLKMASRTISIQNGATLVEGQHDKAINLDGKTQYIDMGANLTCGGNLDNCHQGFTMRFSIKPDKLVNNMYFLDSYPISIFHSNGKLYATTRTSTKSWTVASPGFKANGWHLVDVSWHPETGLVMHIDDAEAGSHNDRGNSIEPVFNIDPRTYFGRTVHRRPGDRYAATSLENFEIWNVRRDVLLANGGGLRFNTPRPEATKPPPVTSTSVPRDDSRTRVFVTSFPNGTTQLTGTGLVPTSTTSIIRLFGESFLLYNFMDLPSETVAPALNETMTVQFLTKDSEGLIYLLRAADGRKVHLSIKNGALLFVIHDGRSAPQQVVLRDPRGGTYDDGKWYTFKVHKNRRNMKFYINNQYITEITANTDIQFVTRGDFYLGGAPSVSQNTNGLVTSNFDGGITDVEVNKYATLQHMILSFLQFVASATSEGKIDIIDRDKIGEYIWYPVPVTPAPEIPTPVTFISASSTFYLKNATDLSRGGSISFKFKTLEPRGLLAFARGSELTPTFLAVEIFDGFLYFIHDFGSVSKRRHFSARRVDDGEWHEVKIAVDNNRMTISLDGRDIPISLTPSEQSRLSFYRLYIGGVSQTNVREYPWLLYSRTGYRGCLSTLKINGIGVDLHRQFRDTDVQGVQRGCMSQASFCQTQPCSSGVCKNLMDDYECYCPNSYYRGENCDLPAYTLSMDGTQKAQYQFLSPQQTHTNDLSIRFLSPLANTLLFTTEADNSNDFIKAELENGRAKITLNVDGNKKVFHTGNNLNNYNWHTLYIRRRADDVEVWVDDEAPIAGVIGGEGYQLLIDRIKFGSMGSTSSLSSNDYIGLMQNFYYEKIDVFNKMKPNTPTLIWISGVSPSNTPIPIYKPITVTSSETHFRLPAMNVARTMKVLFKFRTRESNGLIMYNKGNGGDAFAIELSSGKIRLNYNLGGRNMFKIVPTVQDLNDNQWHTVQVTLNEEGQFSLRVDDANLDVSTRNGDGRLDLAGNPLYIAGLPDQMFSRPEVESLIASRKGFRGCLASIDLNGAVPDLLASNYVSNRNYVVNGCSDLMVACKPDVCGTGQCMPGLEDYWCNCNMTGYVGIPCKDYPIGYYFGKNQGTGIANYTFPSYALRSSDQDEIAFGFMTYQENGVLYRVESALSNQEFIEIRLEDGHIIAESNTGGGIVAVSETSRTFNDGNYHVIRYIRTDAESTLKVNTLPANVATNTGVVSLLDKVSTILIGGKTNAAGTEVQSFNGIIGGVYYNGVRWMDLLYEGQALNGRIVQMTGDVVHAYPYLLIKGGGGITVKPTAGPPPIYIPPDSVVPGDIGGSGFSENPPSGTGGGVGVVGIGDAGGIHTVPGAVAIDVGASSPVAAASLMGPAPLPSAVGARAGVVVGTLLGTLAFMTSLMWALYKLKPGVPACLSPGAGAAGGGAADMSISAPRATSNLAAVQAASGGGGAGGAGAGKVTVVNGAAAGGGGGGGSSTYTSYFQSTSASVGGAGGAGGGAGAGGADQFDSATLRATGTFSNKGTTIGTPGAARAHGGGSSSSYSANYQSNSANYQSNYQSNTLQSMQSYASGQASPGGGGMSSASYSDRNQYLSTGTGDGIPDYDLPVAGTLQSGHSYSSSTLNTHYNYQGRSTNSQHTSVLNIILAGNKPDSPVPVRHEIYTPSMAATGDQAYVDRAEDLVLEQSRSVICVRPPVITSAGDASMTSAVTLKTGSSAGASYNANYYDSSTYSSIQDVTSSSWVKLDGNAYTDMDISTSSSYHNTPTNRKASLQIQPLSGKIGYQRLENSSSESNVNLISTTSRKRKEMDMSLDNMYESTTTVTSSVYAESTDGSLDNLVDDKTSENIPKNLESLMANFADFDSGFSTDLAKFGTESSTDTVYAQVDKSKKTKAKTDSMTTESSIEMTEFGASNTLALDLSGTTQPVGTTTHIVQGSQTDRAETVMEFQRPTISKQASKTSGSSITINVGSDVTDSSSSSTSMVSQTHHTSEASFNTLNTAQLSSIDESSMIIDIGGESSASGSTSMTTTTGNDFTEWDNIISSIRRESKDIEASTLSRMTSSTSETRRTTDVSYQSQTQSSAQTTSSSDNTMTITLDGSQVSAGASTSGTGRDLDSELDMSMGALLTGINVDTAKWDELKDASGFDKSSSE